MPYHASATSVIVFLLFVGIVLALSFYLGSRAKSAKGYFAAHGQVGWFVNGIAFAGDYLSAASFLGICGMIAFYGYDGFLYSIGYLAGWVVALFVITEPIKRLGKYTFADALDSKFNSRGIKLAAAISTLLVSLFYLIPQMVGAGALVRPLLGFPHWAGVLIVGAVVITMLVPGASPNFKGVRSGRFFDKLDFLSLMIALFAGTASLPHILIRYYTVKDGAAARKSTVVGIASIGFFYVLTLFLGLGAMTSGTLDVTDSNMAAPLLARSFGELPFAVISAIAFTTVLGTVSGLIMAASGAVAHDLMANFLRIEMHDHSKVQAGKITAVVVGLVAIVLGILFQKLNVGFLVGWAFNVAASANLPGLVMLLFWRGTTKQGITAAIFTGMLSSLGWILLSQQCYRDVYGLPPEMAIVPFSQPGILTIPLGFAVLIVVSLLSRQKTALASS